MSACHLNIDNNSDEYFLSSLLNTSYIKTDDGEIHQLTVLLLDDWAATLRRL